MSLKLTVIGGGSSYTPELIEGVILRHDKFPVAELCLMDLEEGREKLQIIHDLAVRMIDKAGLDIKVTQTLDRKEALRGADYVITQFRVGFLDAREKDERIPLKYGVIGQETNGPGGMFKALRTIPVILDIIRDCEELCPNAWIINFTNPAGIITQAVARHSKWNRFIGLCNSPIGIRKNVCLLLNVDFARVKMDFAGLNHMVFGIRTYLDGIDVSEQVIEKLALQNQDPVHYPMANLPYTPEFVRALNVIPGPYLRYYYKYDQMLKKAQADARGGQTRAQVVKQVETELFIKYKDPMLAVKPAELEQRGGAFYSDAACDLLSGLYNDTRDIQVVNTINNGAISSLPDDAVVEISAVITKEGPRPLTMGKLPYQVDGIVRQIKAFELAACDAAVSGDYAKALLAMTINPFVGDETKARAILDEMLLAHKDYLPQFG